MDKIIEDEIDTTTADETDCNTDSASNMSSDIELDYDKKHNVLKAKYNDKIIDMRFNKECKSKEDALNIMLMKYLSNIQAHRKSASDYYKKMQENDELKQKIKDGKAKWFQDNKEKLRQQQVERYNTDLDYRQRVIDKNKRAYDKKTEGAEKQKRGRKPKLIEKNDNIEVAKRPRGRPPKKTTNMIIC